MKSRQYHFSRVFAAACLGMLLFGMVIITLGTILPELVQKFGLDEIDTGGLTSILPAGILIGSFLFGPIVDRFSYKYLLVTCALIIMLGMEGIAWSESLWVLQLSLVAIGIGGGAINGGTNALVADISSGSSRSSSANLSLLGVFFGVGALSMPSIVGFLSRSYSSYSIIAVIGSLMMLLIIYFSVIRFPPPKQSISVAPNEILKLVKDPSLILLGMILFFQSGIEGLINSWSTIYLESAGNFRPETALYALSLFVLSLTLTRVLLTFILARIRSYKVLMVSVFLGLIGVGGFWLPWFPGGEIGSLILIGAGLAAGFPIILGYVGTLYPSLSGTAFSFVLVIALTGNIMVNYIMGLTSSMYGINTYSFLLLICILLMIVVLIFTLKRIHHKTYI